MATIVAQFENIAGESQITGFEDSVEAFGISDKVTIVRSGQNSSGRGRYENVVLRRVKDSASPKILTAASSGRDIGTATVSIFRNLEEGLVAYMKIELQSTIVAGYHVQGTHDGKGMVETIELSSPRIAWTYTHYNSSGVESGNVSGGWNQQTGTELI